MRRHALRPPGYLAGLLAERIAAPAQVCDAAPTVTRPLCVHGRVDCCARAAESAKPTDSAGILVGDARR